MHPPIQLFLTAFATLVASTAITFLPISDSTLAQQLRSRVDRAAVTTRLPNPGILTVAHRGASLTAPENTRAALRGAIELGFDYVELDVRETADAVPVVLHDRSVERTTNGSGEINALTFAEVRDLDAGSWFSAEFSGERIPTLEDALQTLHGHACAVWDTKAKPTATMVALFQRYGFDRNCLIITAGGLGARDNQEYVDRLIELWPDAPLMPTVRSLEELESVLQRYPQARAIRVMRAHFSPELTTAAHEAGLLLLTGTIKQVDIPQWHRATIDVGIDLIMLDDIETFESVRAEYTAD